MILCPKCSKVLKSEKAKTAHLWRMHTPEGAIHGNKPGVSNKGNSAWNKGLTKETSAKVKLNSENLQNTLKRKVIEGTFVAPKMGEEARRKLSVEQSLKNRGGKCKWFDYNGQKLQGTWELNVAKKLDEMQIKWYKPKVHKDVFQYQLDGKIKSYTPDLYLPDLGIYLEIKGYWWGNDKEKMRAIFEQHKDKRIVLIEKTQYDKLLQGELVW